MLLGNKSRNQSAQNVSTAINMDTLQANVLINADKHNWYFDTGASAYIFAKSTYFKGNIKPKVDEVTIANNSKI